MTTIHYALNDLDREMDPSTTRGRSECAHTVRRPIDIARRICSDMDEHTSEDPIVTTDRFIIDLHFEGRCRGSEPISYGWTRDFESPHHWVMRGFCKTVSADDPIRAHLLISHTLHAWQLTGLIDTIDDERLNNPGPDPSPDLCRDSGVRGSGSVTAASKLSPTSNGFVGRSERLKALRPRAALSGVSS